MYLIVGLGNPGAEYEHTRHNIGFRVADKILADLSITEIKKKKKCDSFVAESSYSGRKIILVEPQTYMNNSGLAVSALLAWYKIPTQHLVVIYDDVDLEIGQIRVRDGGGAGGHHGVESIINSIGAPDFLRVRVGIGRESLSGDVSDYVLRNIPPDEEEKIFPAISKASEAVLEIVSSGIAAAMNKYNNNK